MSSTENSNGKLRALLEADAEFQTSEFRMIATVHSDRSVSTYDANTYLKSLEGEGVLKREDQGMRSYSSSKTMSGVRRIPMTKL